MKLTTTSNSKGFGSAASLIGLSALALLGVTWACIAAGRFSASQPVASDEALEDCGCTQEAGPIKLNLAAFVTQGGAPKPGQRPPGLPATFVDPGIYSHWFAGLTRNVVPSPSGLHRKIVPPEASTLTTTFSPAGAGSASSAVGTPLSLLIGTAGPWTAAVYDSGWTISPQTDGNTQRVWVRMDLESKLPMKLQAQLIILQSNQMFQMGAPKPIDLGPGGAVAMWFDVGTTPADIQASKNPKLSLDCKAPVYQLGVLFSPQAGAPKAPSQGFQISNLQLGTIASCCGGTSSGAAQTRVGGRTVPDPKGAQTGCCDDASLPATIKVDAKGNLSFDVSLPPGADDDFEPYAEIVDADAGDVNDVYPGVNTHSADWMDRTPCNNNIGGLSEQQIAAITNFGMEYPKDQEQAIASAEMTKYLLDAERALEAKGKELAKQDDEDKGLVNGKKVEMPPPPAPGSWSYREQTAQGGTWAFYPGADIVYVHGLKMDHLYDLFHLPGNDESWTTKFPRFRELTSRSNIVTAKWDPSAPGNAPASSLNGEYYGNGYFKLGADWYWLEGSGALITTLPNLEEGHVPLFLRGGAQNSLRKDLFVGANTSNKGFINRYLTVGYSCADGAKPAAQALLRQIADAMCFGTGVQNPINGNTAGFGSRGIVIVSHSTGGLVTNIAMQLGRRKSEWNSAWVVDKVKLHVADSAAMSGSRLATAAIVIAAIADATVATLLGSAGLPSAPTVAAINALLQVAGWPGNFGQWAHLAAGSILLDLTPTVAQLRWGRYFSNKANGPALSFFGIGTDYVPPTVMVPGGHPTEFAPGKYSWLLLGYDDGVVNMNSASANPNLALRWPSGYLGSLSQNFDMGLFLGSPTLKLVGSKWVSIKVVGNGLNHQKRAIRYFIDMKDVVVPGPQFIVNVDKTLIPRFLAGGPIYQLTPAGMRTDTDSGAVGNMYRKQVQERYPNMFTAVSSASDHYDGTIGSSERATSPDYQATNQNSPNALERNREETFTVGPNDLGVYRSYTPPGLQSLNDPAMSRPVLSGSLPQEVRFRGLRLVVKVLKKVRTYWLIKREYVLLKGWEKMGKFDYVYWYYLGGGRTPNMGF